MNNPFDIGMVGLSVMGRSLALNMADHGFSVAACNRSRQVTEEVLREHPHEKLRAFYTLEDLAGALARPRKVCLMIQAGPPVDAVLDRLLPLLEPGDLVLDGGNSHFEDTRRRAERLAAAGLFYLGVGVSGGEEGARRGPSLMPGGDRRACEAVRPILEAVGAPLGGLPAPVLASAAAYLDTFRAGAVGANLIQAQRDLFGAHTFARTDRPGTFHHDWGRTS